MTLFGWEPTAMWWADNIGRLVVGVLIFLSTTVASYALGRWWGARQAYLDWMNKRFLGRINIGVNSFRDGTLRIRTLMERSLEEIFLNPVAIETVRKAARLTTHENPLLPLPKEDRWFLLNFVLNAVVEQFALGMIRSDAGQSVQCVTYLLFLTHEQEGDDRVREIRALLIQEEHLREFPYPNPGDLPALEADYHKDRVNTLRRAAEAYQKDKDLFLRVEVCL